MRIHYEHQLEQLNTDIIEMGTMAQSAMSKAIKALNEHDRELAKEIINGDSAIDSISRTIESRCMNLVLSQQPVATDFRFLSAAIKIVNDLERIGDMAQDISEIIVYIAKDKYKVSDSLNSMAMDSINMVSRAVDSFVKRDAQSANAVIASDDIVDKAFESIKNDLEKELKKKSESVQLALDKLMIAKYFERIADHAVNIADWVVYAITALYKGEKL